MGRKKKLGRPPKKQDPDKVVQRAVQLATGQVGKGIERRDDLVKSEELSDSMNSFLHARTGMFAEEFYERVEAKLELLVDKLADDLLEKHDKIAPGSLPVALGIIIDKVNNLKGRPQTTTANLSVGFGPSGRSREDILKILGNEKLDSPVIEVKAEKLEVR